VPPPPGAVLLDANVFVSAIKSLPRVTGSFRLIVRLIDLGVRLVGNEVLAEEYLRYAQSLPSPTASALAASILGSMEIIHVEDRFVRACAAYFGAGAQRIACMPRPASSSGRRSCRTITISTRSVGPE